MKKEVNMSIKEFEECNCKWFDKGKQQTLKEELVFLLGLMGNGTYIATMEDIKCRIGEIEKELEVGK